MSLIPPRWLGLPLRRFVVADHSMEPALRPGDGLLASRYVPVRVGQLRCLVDPGQHDRWLVKRVSATHGETIDVRSDNQDVPTSDSRIFGPVPAEGTYCVLIRIPARLL